MTLPANGELSFSEIQTEHDGSEPISLSEYYGAGGGDLPGSGEIAVSDFYGTTYGRIFTINEGYAAPTDQYYGYFTGELTIGSIAGSPSAFRGIDVTSAGFGDTMGLGDIAVFELDGNRAQDIFTSIIFEDLIELFTASVNDHYYDGTYGVTTWIWYGPSKGFSIPARWDGSGQSTVIVKE